MDDFGGCLGVIFAIGLVIGIIYLIIVYVVPILLAVGVAALIIFAVIGCIIGLVIAIRNYFKAIAVTVSLRKDQGAIKDQAVRSKLVPLKSNYTGLIYEQCAAKSYFFGPCFEDILQIIASAFSLNFKSAPDFDNGEHWWSRVLFFVLALCQVVCMYVIGTVFTLALSVVLLALFIVFMIVAYPIVGIVLLCETIYFKAKSISYRCPSCKEEYNIPRYTCPVCHITHIRLKPGLYGLHKRKCICGCILPLTVKQKGKIRMYNKTDNEYFFKPILFSELDSFCPKCGRQHNAGVSHPLSIALIGGASSGKTTFKVAFLHDLIEDELMKYDIDYDFPSESAENEYNLCKAYFAGKPIPATARGASEDISAFSFFLKHSKLGTDRLIQIYDMPGEAFISGDAKEGWNNYTFSEGAAFLLDPFSITSVKAQNADEISREMGICEVNINTICESLINTLNQVKVKKHGGKFTIPIALVINKVDTALLKQQCGSDAVSRLMTAMPDLFGDRYVAMDYICRCFLAENGGDNFISNLDLNFDTVHFFYSSPMGFVPKGINARFRPENVLPVMQWMLQRADKKLGSVWRQHSPIHDLTDEQKQLYRTHPEYYTEFVASKVIMPSGN